MKKIFFLFVVLALITTAVVMTVKSMTQGLSATAEVFFTAVAEHDAKAAWAGLSTAFRQTHTPDQLNSFLAESGLDDYESAIWSGTSYMASSGELTGRVYTKTGTVVPVRMDFVREEEGWRIHGMDATLPALTLIADESLVPDLANLEAKVSEAVHDLGLALRMNDFSMFRAHVSALWQASASAEEMRASFAPFLERGQELMDYAAEKPVFNAAPAIDDKGVLRLVGSIPRQDGVLRFDMGFVFEYPDWKLRDLRLSL